MQALRFFVFLIIFSSICVQAGARVILRCEGVFAPSLSEIFIQAHFEVQKNFPNSPKLNLNARTARKLRSLLKSQRLQEITSLPELLQKQQEILDVIFPPKIDSYLLKNQSERESLRLQKVVFEAVLSRGFQGQWQAPYEISGLANLRSQWIKLKSKGLFQITLLPWFLPKIKGPQLSPELLTKILDEGFEAHALEVQNVLKLQSRAEAYQIFRKLYSPVVLGSLFLVQSYFAYEALRANQDQQVEKSIEELKKAGLDVETMLVETRQQIIDEAYAAILLEFREKFGEDPTEQEKQQILEKITLRLKKQQSLSQ